MTMTSSEAPAGAAAHGSATNRLRVANVIEEGRLGGPQIRIVLAARAMKEEVETVVVMPQKDSDAFRRRCEEAEVPCVRLPLSRLGRSLPSLARYALTFPLEVVRLARWIRRADVDVVHASGGAWQYKGVIAARLAGRPVLWHLNDTSMPAPVRWVFGCLSGLATGYIFASRRSQEYYAQVLNLKRPTYAVPAPVDTQHFAPQPARSVAGEEVAAGLVVGTVANVNPVKGLETLVRTAAKVGAQRTDVTFEIVGPVFETQQAHYQDLLHLMDELAVTNVVFRGALGDPRAFLSRTDIYLCTSNAESSPLSVWEAMSMARPIVSTDVGDVGVYVRHGEAGLLAPVGDAETLARHVLAFASDESERARAGRIARATAIEHLDVAQCGARHVAAYRAVTNLPGRRAG